MKRAAFVLLVLVLVVVCADLAVWWRRTEKARRGPPAGRVDAGKTAPRAPAGASVRPVRTPVTGLSAAEKAARVERIKRDYDEVRAKASAEYSAAGTAFPGGLNAFLRQLALLERELHNDYAAILTPRELEDLEMRDTTAGQRVQALLGDTAATEEQRRAVFRLQRSYDNEFALTFDLTPPTLLAREQVRQRTQEQICNVLGPALRAAWLKGEGPDYGNLAAFAAQQGLPADAAFALWRVKNDFTLRQLEIKTRPSLPAEQMRIEQALIAQQARVQVLGIIGAGAFQAADDGVLGWLPRPK